MDLTVKQIQADLPFENDFRLPVESRSRTRRASKTHRVELSGWSTTVALPAAGRPRRVTFDKGGWLVCEVKYERPIGEVLDELAQRRPRGAPARGAAARGRLRPRSARGRRALGAVLADAARTGDCKQEAAIDLGRMGGPAAARGAREGARGLRTRACGAPSALALGECGAASSAAALRRAVETDARRGRRRRRPRSRSAACARPGTKEYLTQPALPRPSRYWDSIRIGALIGLGKLEDAVARRRSSTPTRSEVRPGGARRAARGLGRRAAPEDPKLAERLRQSHDRPQPPDPRERRQAPRRAPPRDRTSRSCESSRPTRIRPSPSSRGRRSRRPKAFVKK